MKNKTGYKLLTKTTLIYLIFTLTAFLASTVFLIREADEYINIELERRFQYSEKRVSRSIERAENERFVRDAEIIELSSKPENLFAVTYSDTLITDSESANLEPFRKKTYIVSYDNRNYRVSIVKSISDFYRLRDDIFEALVPAFFILAFGIVFFNYFMSGFLFKPFNKILHHMRAYKVGEKNLDQVNTTTTEFIRMQNLFYSMIQRIDEDYDNLKQYTENMAHEIQTPLTVIRNKLENLITDEQLMQKNGKEIKIIFDETNHLSKLGQTLNLITRIENREFKDTKEIHTKAVIEKHLEAIQESIQLRNLQVETSLSEMHKLYLDPVLLDIILKNLIRNAIQYTKNTGPLKIQSEQDKLCISNYGEPLPFEEDKLFVRFQRNKNSQKSLGLGLSIVKKICDLNNLVLHYTYSDNFHIFTIENMPADIK